MYLVRDLAPKTFYLIRARAKNLAGVSDESNMIFLQTNEGGQVVGELMGKDSLASKAVHSHCCCSLLSTTSAVMIAISFLRSKY